MPWRIIGRYPGYQDQTYMYVGEWYELPASGYYSLMQVLAGALVSAGPACVSAVLSHHSSVGESSVQRLLLQALQSAHVRRAMDRGCFLPVCGAREKRR